MASLNDTTPTAAEIARWHRLYTTGGNVRRRFLQEVEDAQQSAAEIEGQHKGECSQFGDSWPGTAIEVQRAKAHAEWMVRVVEFAKTPANFDLKVMKHGHVEYTIEHLRSVWKSLARQTHGTHWKHEDAHRSRNPYLLEAVKRVGEAGVALDQYFSCQPGWPSDEVRDVARTEAERALARACETTGVFDGIAANGIRLVLLACFNHDPYRLKRPADADVI